MVKKSSKVLQSEGMAFEHFHFPELFFRQRKKASISFVDQEILEIARNAGISCNDAVAPAAVVIALLSSSSSLLPS